MNNTKFTVIIPTRERYDVLEWALRSITTQTYENLEIIVSDNFSQDETEKLVNSFDDRRIRYINTGKRLSMSENWEFALSHVTSGWVGIVGDDDALLPDSLEKVATLIQNTGTRAIRSSVCNYQWPSVGDDNYGRLKVPTKSGWEKRDAKIYLENVLLGKSSYTELPMLYNGGFVDFSILHEIKEITGAFYKSCSPDVYSAIAISSVIPDYIYSFEPFAVNGASRHSNGTDSFSRRNLGKKSPMQIFNSETNLPFHPDIPMNSDLTYPLSLQALVYESYLQSSDLRQDRKFVDHQNQLEIILANSGRHYDSVKDWCMIFADLHDLDFERAVQQEIGGRKKTEIFRLNRKLISFFQSSIIANRSVHIKNSYEASLYANLILRGVSGKIRRISTLYKKKNQR